MILVERTRDARSTADECRPVLPDAGHQKVTQINGQPFNALSYADTTPVSPNGGSITFRTPFLDFPGTWVFHCHILGHEDGGMMGIMQVS